MEFDQLHLAVPSKTFFLLPSPFEELCLLFLNKKERIFRVKDNCSKNDSEV
jgi:hypothetical protein